MQIFVENCRKMGIPSHLHHTACSVMLKDRANQVYFDRLMKENLNFDNIIQEWRSTTFLRVKANPEKDLAQCFEILVNKPQKIYKGLVSSMQDGDNEASFEKTILQQYNPADNPDGLTATG
ncbi:hypothetical protein B0T26DRAFT_680927 [Lasiosphaeria miniovina]|uniref:Uncharacterized protein n=1 Tax=Lasiosphaeria miniovina TaxID=1954250 RepID=A0AA40DJN5_9PEZI|nr:uncharacterized protein B0T26DRAFT_680927 [Lasiosphaeria miniovina]KAK0703207.1 hypothetical protein B0T26DRAFT_680927 [Lasiosphaeria miniovina]